MRAPRRRPWLRLTAITVILVIVVVADQRGLLLAPARGDRTAYDGLHVRVERVLDGDTIEVAVPDEVNDRSSTRVRIWGIDCPEMPGRDRAAEPFAFEATASCRRRLAGGKVTLALEPHRMRDRYGRLLAHVDLPDGTSLAEALLTEGLAVADDRWPHARLRRYEDAERLARGRGLGVWRAGE